MSDVAPTAGGSNGSTEAAADALEPTQAEIDEWAAREKARREAWLAGPTEDEKREYANRVKRRRLAGTFDEGQAMLDQGVRRGLQVGREGQLAAEGAMALLYSWSRRKFADLVKAGREWEEETAIPTALPGRRRRVPFDDNTD